MCQGFTIAVIESSFKHSPVADWWHGGAWLHTHTHTHTHTQKGVSKFCTSDESPMFCRPSSLKRGLTRGDRVLLGANTAERFNTVTLCHSFSSGSWGLIKTTADRRVSFVTGYLLKKQNAINRSGENKQKIRDVRCSNHHMRHLKWRGNKTPIRDPIHRFISSTCKHSWIGVIPPPRDALLSSILSRFDWQFGNYSIQPNNKKAPLSQLFGTNLPKMRRWLSPSSSLFQLLPHAWGDVSSFPAHLMWQGVEWDAAHAGNSGGFAKWSHENQTLHLMWVKRPGNETILIIIAKKNFHQ